MNIGVLAATAATGFFAYQLGSNDMITLAFDSRIATASMVAGVAFGCIHGFRMGTRLVRSQKKSIVWLGPYALAGAFALGLTGGAVGLLCGEAISLLLFRP